jgi:hypothetical protein
MERAVSLVVGAYRFVDRLGEGGVGQVYRAQGPTGIVAVKILGPSADFDSAARARFAREVRALRELAHPNIVLLLDHGFDEELGPYLVMPLLDGSNVRRLIAGHSLGPDAGVLLARPVVAALQTLHDAGYVHRDLKPENLMATVDGRVVVIDFGLAFRDGMTKHTDTGAAAGTVGYMAPEQIEGQPVAAAADIFSVGVMLYEWITGRRPFARQRASEEVVAALAGVFVALKDVERRASPGLTALVSRCLSPDPKQRPTATELLALLDAEIAWPHDVAVDAATKAEVGLRAVCADPSAYHARIASARVNQLHDAAVAAQNDQRPFAALALCDRGLAYADNPDDTKKFREFVRDIESVRTAPANQVSRDDHEKPSSPTAAQAKPVAADSNQRGSLTSGKRKTKTVAIALLAAGVTGAWLTYRWWPQRGTDVVEDPWGALGARPAPSEAEQRKEAERQNSLSAISTIAGTLGRAIDRVQDDTSNRATVRLPPGTTAPTTATGWLQLAKTQTSSAAVSSIRQALELQPSWPEAQDQMCIALTDAEMPGGSAACDFSVRNHPDDWTWVGRRGIGQFNDAMYAAAIRDLDAVINHDDAANWRMARGAALEKRGRVADAKQDFAWACEHGVAQGCNRAK